jgi:carbon-monoxide dehydrogenase medium subunit
VDDVIALLAAHDDVKVLAGGQSLVATMNFRLARPAVLVDINRIPGLDRIDADDGHLEVGSLVRHARFEQPVEPGLLGSLLAEVVRYVGHHPIRVRGTFAGSIAHADPAAEWAVVARTLDAAMIARGPGGTRTIEADRFFHTLFTTDLADDEVLTAVRLPILGSEHRAGFAEFSRRAGDFALVMALFVCRVSDGLVRDARLGLGGVSDTPIRVPEVEAAVEGMEATAGVAGEAAAVAADHVHPLEDIHGSSEYRTDLVRAMVRRAVERALA